MYVYIARHLFTTAGVMTEVIVVGTSVSFLWESLSLASFLWESLLRESSVAGPEPTPQKQNIYNTQKDKNNEGLENNETTNKGTTEQDQHVKWEALAHLLTLPPTEQENNITM